MEKYQTANYNHFVAIWEVLGESAEKFKNYCLESPLPVKILNEVRGAVLDLHWCRQMPHLVNRQRPGLQCLTELKTKKIILIIWCKTYLTAFRRRLLTIKEVVNIWRNNFVLVQGDAKITNICGLFTFYFLPATLKAIYFIGTNYIALRYLC